MPLPIRPGSGRPSRPASAVTAALLALAVAPAAQSASELEKASAEHIRTVTGAVDGATVSGLLRTVQRINNPAAERVRQWWAEAALNALGGFLAGWLSYLTLAHTLPAPVVVLTVAACAYTPVLLIEKFNDFMRSKN